MDIGQAARGKFPHLHIEGGALSFICFSRPLFALFTALTTVCNYVSS